MVDEPFMYYNDGHEDMCVSIALYLWLNGTLMRRGHTLTVYMAFGGLKCPGVNQSRSELIKDLGPYPIW